jgi:hypothetical protein
MGILDHVCGLSSEQDRVWAQVAGMHPDHAGERLLMVWQAFIDESEKDGLFVLAGYIASAEKWAEFSAKWAPLARRFGRVDSNGRWYFHMTDHAGRKDSGEYLPQFYDAIMEAAIFGIVWAIKLEDFKNAWDRVVVFGDKGAIETNGNLKDSLYIFSVSLNLYGFHKALQDGDGKINIVDFRGETIDFYFDERTEKKVLLSAWDEFKAIHDVDNRWFGATPRFEDDKVFLPLQAADFLAGAARQHLTNVADRARVLMDKLAAGDAIDIKELFPYGNRSREFTYMITYPSEDELFEIICGLFRDRPVRIYDKKSLILTKID